MKELGKLGELRRNPFGVLTGLYNELTGVRDVLANARNQRDLMERVSLYLAAASRARRIIHEYKAVIRSLGSIPTYDEAKKGGYDRLIRTKAQKALKDLYSEARMITTSLNQAARQPSLELRLYLWKVTTDKLIRMTERFDFITQRSAAINQRPANTALSKAVYNRTAVEQQVQKLQQDAKIEVEKLQIQVHRLEQEMSSDSPYLPPTKPAVITGDKHEASTVIEPRVIKNSQIAVNRQLAEQVERAVERSRPSFLRSLGARLGLCEKPLTKEQYAEKMERLNALKGNRENSEPKYDPIIVKHNQGISL